jgi:hypothetical protein
LARQLIIYLLLVVQHSSLSSLVASFHPPPQPATLSPLFPTPCGTAPGRGRPPSMPACRRSRARSRAAAGPARPPPSPCETFPRSPLPPRRRLSSGPRSSPMLRDSALARSAACPAVAGREAERSRSARPARRLEGPASESAGPGRARRRGSHPSRNGRCVAFLPISRPSHSPTLAMTAFRSLVTGP